MGRCPKVVKKRNKWRGSRVEGGSSRLEGRSRAEGGWTFEARRSRVGGRSRLEGRGWRVVEGGGSRVEGVVGRGSRVQPSSSSSAENQNSAQSPGSVHRDGNSLLGPALATTIESDAQRQPSPVRPARAVSPVRPVSEILARQDVPGRVYTHTQLLEFITKLDNERIQQ